jgi:hypothetical protein
MFNTKIVGTANAMVGNIVESGVKHYKTKPNHQH